MLTKKRGGGYQKGSAHIVKSVHLTSVLRPQVSAWPNVEKNCYGIKPYCAMREHSHIGDANLACLCIVAQSV